MSCDVYQRIVCKKNVLNDLFEEIHNNWFSKKALCVFSNYSIGTLKNNVLNILSLNQNSFSCFTLKHKHKEIDDVVFEITSSSKKYDYIVGVGGGVASEVVKTLSSILKIPSYFISTNFSVQSCLNDLIVKERDSSMCARSVYHEKTYFDEDEISTLNDEMFDQAKMSFLSYSLIIPLLLFDNNLYDKKEKYDVERVENIFYKFLLQEQVAISDKEKRLRLLDGVVELASFMEEAGTIIMPHIIYAKILQKKYQLPFAYLQVLSSKILIRVCQEFFSLKSIKCFDVKEKMKALYYVDKYTSINPVFLSNHTQNKLYNNDKILNKINIIKQKIAEKCENIDNNILNSDIFSKLFLNINLNTTLSLLSVLPYYGDCSAIVKLIGSVGLLSF